MSKSKYGHRPHNWFEAIVNKLGGEEAANRFLRGELEVELPSPYNFPVWKTAIVRADFKTADYFIEAFSRADIRVSETCHDMFRQIPFRFGGYASDMEFDLVVVSLPDLGLKDKTPARYVIAKALSLGLDLCYLKVGPQLRLDYRDQPKGESLIVMTEYITDSHGHNRIFSLGRNEGEGLWIHGHYVETRNFDVNDRLVFVRPRKPAYR